MPGVPMAGPVAETDGALSTHVHADTKVFGKAMAQGCYTLFTSFEDRMDANDSASADNIAIAFWVDDQGLSMQPLCTTLLRSSACGCEGNPPYPNRSARGSRCHPYRKDKVVLRTGSHQTVLTDPGGVFMIAPAWLGHPPRCCSCGAWDVRPGASEEITPRFHGPVPGGILTGHETWGWLPPSARAGVPGTGLGVGSSANADILYAAPILRHLACFSSFSCDCPLICTEPVPVCQVTSLPANAMLAFALLVVLAHLPGLPGCRGGRGLLLYELKLFYHRELQKLGVDQ